MKLKLKLSAGQIMAWQDWIYHLIDVNRTLGLDRKLIIWIALELSDYAEYVSSRVNRTQRQDRTAIKPKKYSLDVPIRILVILSIMRQDPPAGGLIERLIADLNDQYDRLESGIRY